MKIAICDDELCFLDELERLLIEWGDRSGEPVHICRFDNGDSLIDAARTAPPDLIFLDVLMPLLNGIETAKELRRDLPDVALIFLTSSREYAVDSYDVNAFYYLLKPVTPERLFPLLDRQAAQQNAAPEAVTLPTPEGYRRIFFKDVVYLEAQNKQVLVAYTNGITLLLKERFQNCEQLFSPDRGFFKCHRSYLISLGHVEQFSKTRLLTDTGVWIPISRNSYLAFREAYFQQMFQDMP